MAVLHEYVPASEEEGYYLYAAHDGANITYQVSALARNLFDQLDSCEVDEQVPAEVFQILHRLGHIYTHQSGADQTSEASDISTKRQTKRLSPMERETLFRKLLSSELEAEQRQALRSYLDANPIETETQPQQKEWVPDPPDTNTYRGDVARTFQDDEWGFIESDEAPVEDDMFFHIDELERISIAPGIRVEFAYTKTTDGYEATHVRPLTDTLGRELEEVPETGNISATKTLQLRDDSTVGADGLAEGEYVEAKIDRAKGNKGIGTKGHLHIHHRRGSGSEYMHFGTRDDPVPVNKWVVVQITECHDGYAEAKMKEPPADVDPPLYMP